ncbi:MAG: T9SS type A sorting domain-containing protein [Ignavibacterium sp.]|nr:T9SS type A sorting domain-containing protein [Ignavibacterium sp.]
MVSNYNEHPIRQNSVIFDASSLSSGVYFYKIQAGNYIETRKMLLLK